jgi:sugar lactone lactonase YvrE
VPIPNYGGYGGLAVDGKGTAWFASLTSLFCYAAGNAIREFRLDRQAQASNFRTAPDGSVWFAEIGRGRLGRIGLDGVLTERQLDFADKAYWDVAVGPDGSVWYPTGHGPGSGVARMRPDGRVTTYPVPDAISITVDSHGNAWIPQWNHSWVARVSNSGEVLEFTVTGWVKQVAEARDGRMWFLNLSCLPRQQIGWIDAGGQVKLFDAPIVDDAAFPNAMYRAPDGALWFGTIDGRLVRLVSETDVTIYSTPWPGQRIGTFAVSPGNRIVMIGTKELVNLVDNRDVLDFPAGNGIRLAGVQAIPGPQHYAKDAAEAVAYPGAIQASGSDAKAVLLQSWEGTHAALFDYVINQNRCQSYDMFIYVVEDSGGWSKYDVFEASGAYPLRAPRAVIPLKFQTGCLNVHQSPSLASQTLSCLPSGTTVYIDQLPAYADGYLWWHASTNDNPHTPLGWAVQKYLLCTDYMIGRLPQC